MDIYFSIKKQKQTICFVIFSIKRHITSHPYLNRLWNPFNILRICSVAAPRTQTRQNNETENPKYTKPKIAKSTWPKRPTEIQIRKTPIYSPLTSLKHCCYKCIRCFDWWLTLSIMYVYVRPSSFVITVNKTLKTVTEFAIILNLL